MNIRSMIKKNKLFYKMAKSVIDYYESRCGKRSVLEMHRALFSQEQSIKNGIAIIQKRWPELDISGSESPIFILSAGWRSGSTLIQRLVMSKEQILIWGEPYNPAGVIEKLSEPMKVFAKEKWPAKSYFLSAHDKAKLDELWIANLFPDIEFLHRAGKNFISTLLKDSAVAAGFARWGMKEVRLTVDHAHYLKWLYPDAKFILLYRNPYDAYVSYRPYREWYNTWPDNPVFTPRAFAKHWLKLVVGFVENYKEIDALVIKYEDVIDGCFDIDILREYLSIDIDENVLKKKVGGTREDGVVTPGLELRQIRNVVEPFAQKLGYQYEG